LGAVPLANGPTGNGSTISGATAATLSIGSAQPGDNGNYTVVIANAYGSVTSTPPAVLTISASCVAPSLTGPNNTTVIQGNNGTFSASAAGNPVPNLQWRRNGVDISGQTASSYTVTSAQYPADDGAVFSLVASNACGMVTNSATLTVIVPPTISVQPVSLVVTSTQSATFSVTASGVPNPTYQWYFNNNLIGGATSSSYNIASATAANIGTYKVVVSNAAGSVTSASATLIVNSVMATTAFSPANGATGICYDTPLAVTFNAAPSLGTNGTIKIFNINNSVTPVDTISVALGAVQQRTFPSDGQSFTYQTIQISGNTAKIFPHFNVLSSNATYYVTIDNGAFTDASGAYFSGITANNVWQFATKVGGPADTNNPVVNADGSGDFLTVQGAVNSLATGTNAVQRVINIRNGLYTEIVDITGRHNVTFRGQSRAGAVVAFPNNATFQAANSGTTHARMTFKVNANDIVLDTLTVSNSTPQGGSQAEALMIESNAKRCIVNNSEIDSRQDTILGNQNSSQAYFYQSIVKGNFDYIWGGGNFYFDQCTMQTIAGTGSGQLTAARTDTAPSQSLNFPWLNPFGTYSANGMSFVNCTFTADPGLGAITLAGSNGTSNNVVSWFGCDFATNYVAPSSTLFNGNYLFWQSANTTNGIPVTFPVLTTLSGNDARLLAATNIPTWFYGWTPTIPLVITTNPASLTVTAGQSAAFTVAAVGIPNPTYQWQHAGTNLPGATSATLNLAVATMDNAGSYACTATTPAGSATSSTATLTVNPLAITVTPAGKTKVYGSADPALTYTFAPALIGSDTFSGALARAAGENVGSYAITQGTLSLNANYSITFIATSNLVITPLAVAVTADAKTKVYGAANPALTYTFAPALIGSDTFSGALARVAGENVGSYAINQGTLSLSGNYTLGYTGANLVITPAALSITANNTNKVLGATITFAGTEFTASGLLGGDVVTSVTLTSAGAGAGAAAGSYLITPSAAVGSGLGNYTITYNNGALIVSGSPDSSFTGIVVNNDGSVTLTFSGSNGLTYRIQATSDLGSPSWTDVSTNTVSGGSASFTDTNTSGVTKFYRVVYP
jgi:pectin methylesterase-like acyl-CoA thioesterase